MQLRRRNLCSFSILWIWALSGVRGVTVEKMFNARVAVSPPDISYYKGSAENVSRLLDSRLHGYDKRLRPDYKDDSGTKKGPPVEIDISMHITSISSISEADMDFTVDVYFRQYWTDSRLGFAGLQDEEFCIGNEMLEKIWWPDTFFANAKDAHFHVATTKNAFLRINSNGTITQSLRLTVKAICNMDLKLFPMDYQICALEIESYGYSTKDISYKWHGDKVKIEDGVRLPQFKIRGWKTITKVANTSTGSYSRLAAQFLFVRSLGYYMIQIYIPSNLIVVLSWVSFWINPDAAPARVALGITTVLTMTTLISSTNSSLPKISYLKSIDIFLIINFCMVFMSLMEYAAVAYLCTRAKEEAERQKKQKESIFNDMPYAIDKSLSRPCGKFLQPMSPTGIATEVHLTSPTKRKNCHENNVEAVVSPCRPRLSLDNSALEPKSSFRVDANFLDYWSRIIFPIVFMIFNTVYWVYYMVVMAPQDFDFEIIP